MTKVTIAHLVVLLAAAGCSASTKTTVKERAEHSEITIESGPRRHADVDLTGDWMQGSGDEPAVREIQVHADCNLSPAVWIIEQKGDSLNTWAMPSIESQGTPSEVHVSSAPLKGVVSGVDVIIGSGLPRYVLRYDSTSGHLRGTLDGKPFWAVRQHIIRALETCIPPP